MTVAIDEHAAVEHWPCSRRTFFSVVCHRAGLLAPYLPTYHLSPAIYHLPSTIYLYISPACNRFFISLSRHLYHLAPYTLTAFEKSIRYDAIQYDTVRYVKMRYVPFLAVLWVCTQRRSKGRKRSHLVRPSVRIPLLSCIVLAERSRLLFLLLLCGLWTTPFFFRLIAFVCGV